MSRYSCAKIIQNGGGDGNGDVVIDGLSMGSVLLIIVSVVFIAYVIIGCGYNGVANGRVGFDAMPNKQMWHQLCRLSMLGCLTVKDTLCFCGSIPKQYESL